MSLPVTARQRALPAPRIAAEEPLPPEDRSGARSAASIEDLYQQQAPRLLRFFARRTVRQDAGDLVQESFARLWQRVEEVDGTKAKSYLFTTAHHLLVDEARKKDRNTPMEPQHERLQWAEQDQPDLQAVLEEALATLPEVQRSVVLLRDLEGYAYEEIAETTGLNVTQVKVYIYRGRTALKNYIGSLENVL